MEIEWKISAEDVAHLTALLQKQADNALVRDRRSRNLAKLKPQIDKDRFWSQLVGMRLTSVQRSGPNSHVARFIRSIPFPLGYEAVSKQTNPKEFVFKALKAAGGIRFSEVISEQFTTNFYRLEAGEWDQTLRQCDRLIKPVSREIEQEVAEYIRSTFDGFGPKQSRNLLQALGLTRYEIPIDSRVTAWLNEFGFPIKLSAAALADTNYYNFVSDGICALCAACDVFPCILDAAVFALKDGSAWDDDNIVF